MSDIGDMIAKAAIVDFIRLISVAVVFGAIIGGCIVWALR